MQERTELAELRAQLAYAKNEFERVTRLVEEKIVDPTQYDIARRDLETARQSVEIKAASVAETEAAVRRLDPAAAENDSPAVLAGLAVLEEEVKLAEATLQPIVLVSPIDGRVSEILMLPGTGVTAGNPIVTVASPEVLHILGYVGQPLRVEPTVGMKVEVRSRGVRRTVGQGEIIHVGPRMQLFDAPLRIRGMGNAQERGLPIVVTVPPEMKLRPGELVDLTLAL
jgi:multidrug resistance efflux pump